MAKTNAQGLTAKDIEEISQRLHNSGGKPVVKKPDEPGKTPTLSKEQIEEINTRLFQKDPQSKKKELAEKAQQAREKERPDNMGFQSKDKDSIEEITKRLFIADYVNRNVQNGGVTATGKQVTNDELEAITNRLFIANYANKNIVENKSFYDTIMNKKKATEKVLSKQECKEMAARLHKMSREPAECNKELKGLQTFATKGIYGTYAMTAPEVCSTLI